VRRAGNARTVCENFLPAVCQFVHSQLAIRAKRNEFIKKYTRLFAGVMQEEDTLDPDIVGRRIDKR
jgi:hypothetical protein